jgi:hypothetical protein
MIDDELKACKWKQSWAGFKVVSRDLSGRIEKCLVITAGLGFGISKQDLRNFKQNF